ncbi:N(4)-(beta-N-acetylglucosaminyl)-L-asparaginase [Lactobacillus sp. UCMA15818]|mgnify:FL=1|uniref:N(4)-(beta-N-acetylglucosaminyl)-L-asparaginase n=1 Tax=Lactobacillaceae TaxID=33958 RepID=UPI0025B21897|nr:N(4)-(beta-N-acetylglucosaminyl)-L-asparaginase [Lactobacillus sp. UCMA15818]MDN2453348.1 N(4)-(beta-N-acetylglucosaminyl)-L-asparaginase [Lactobacillus sp. UCMA15818]
MWGIIATWSMSLDSIKNVSQKLSFNETAADMVVSAVKQIEDFPFYKSVGYGGLPNEEQEVELDASYMDGDTLSIGAIGAVKDFANPVLIAKSLSQRKVNNFLVGTGAEKYASINGFQRKNMLTKRAKAFYEKRIKQEAEEIKPYAGHDTVGMVCLDAMGSMSSATSTSGLFMKKAGRVGDSPIPGSGFYVDSQVGGASATGLGEDIMKGCLSYEIVRLMKEGKSPQIACDQAVFQLDKQLRERQLVAGDISVVAMNKKGGWGCATNIKDFSFVVATAANPKPVVYVANESDGHTKIEPASSKWLQEYFATRGMQANDCLKG